MINLDGIKALIVGMEKSGRAAYEFLHARGAEVTATDLKPQSVDGFRPQTDELFDELDAPVKRVAAKDVFVAYAPVLEDAILPQPEDLYRAMKQLAEY